jgi:aminoglycoside 6'-N-acetyltransferase I
LRNLRLFLLSKSNNLAKINSQMTGSLINIRPVRESDFGEWLRLRRLLWEEATLQEHQEEMSDIYEHHETQLVLVADTGNGKLAGFLEASIRPFVEDCHSDHVGYLEGWFVESNYRQLGIGKKLVGSAERWAKSHGCEEMASDSEIGNNLSVVAHSQLGYSETSRLIHWRKEL